MAITLRVILVVLCLVLLFLAAFPSIIRDRASWISVGWAGVLVLAILLLLEVPA